MPLGSMVMGRVLYCPKIASETGTAFQVRTVKPGRGVCDLSSILQIIK